MDQFEHSYHATQPSVDRYGDIVELGQAGIDVGEHLLGCVLTGALMGPLALEFKEKPEALGAFAAKVVRGARSGWLED